MPTFENVIVAILYLIPGFLVREIYHAKYPIKTRSDLIVILYSILYSVGIFALVRFIDYQFLNNILQSNDISTFSYRFIGALFGTSVVVGFIHIGIGYIRYIIAMNFESITPPSINSAWGDTMSRLKDEDWSIVFLNDGSIYAGYIKKYTYDPDKENQDFLLKRAIRIEQAGNEFNKLYYVMGFGVYINTSNVKRIEFLSGSKKRK